MEIPQWITFTKDYWVLITAFFAALIFCTKFIYIITLKLGKIDNIERDIESIEQDVDQLKKDSFYLKGKITAIEKMVRTLLIKVESA